MTGLNRKTALIPITAIFLGLFAAPITAYAQEWRTAWRNVYTNRFGSTVSSEVLYDSSSMRRFDQKIRVWVKEVASFSDVTGFSEYLAYFEFDCEERSYRILQGLHRIGEYEGPVRTGWIFAVPGSTGADKLNFFCYGKNRIDHNFYFKI